MRAKAELQRCRDPRIVSVGSEVIVIECEGKRYVVGVKYVREAAKHINTPV